MRKLAVVAVLASLVAGTASADDDKEEARRYFEAGLALLKAENYEGAALSFDESVKLHPTMSGLFNLANCYKALERYDEALAALFRLRRDYKDRLSEEMRVESGAIEKEIRNLVGMLRVEVDRPGAAILVGGREVGVSPLSRMVLLAPGDHEVTARMPGVEFGVERVRMLAGMEATVNLKGTDTGVAEGGSTPSTESMSSHHSPRGGGGPSTDSPSRVWTWVAGGVGVAAAVGAGITGGLTLSRASDIKDRCDGNDCPMSLKDEADAARNLGTVANVLTGVAAAGIVAGVVLFFLEPGLHREEPVATVGLAPLPGGAAMAVGGRF